MEKVIALVYLAEEAGKTWSMENQKKGVHNVELDQCPYGAHTKKSARIVTTSDWMSRVNLKCEDVRPHFHLP